MPRRRKHPYLTLRDGIWYVRKKIKVGEKARTIKRSTGYSQDQKDLAEAVGSQIIREETEKLLFGYSDRTWGEAAAKLLELERDEVSQDNEPIGCCYAYDSEKFRN